MTDEQIYLGIEEKRTVPEMECHKEARQLGYSDWWAWHDADIKKYDRISDCPSVKYCMQFT